MSVARHHAEWLSLVETSGPFLSMPVLLRAFPQGLDGRESERAARLREAYEEWLDRKQEPAVHRTWVQHVLRELLEYPLQLLAEGQAIPPGLEAAQPQFAETLRPDWVLKHRDADGRPQLLIALYAPSQKLDSPVVGKIWKASPSTRMMELLHAANLPLGLVTNGEHWMLVYAPRSETTGFASWYADLWMQEPITLRAFQSLLHLRRFLGVAADETLSALFAASSKDQQEVTDQLGYQVRRAVEMLVQAFDRIDAESGRQLFAGMPEKELYDSALTVMMRLVFLFSAEERKLLLLGDPLYDQYYAVSTLRELLRERADQQGEEVLERRHDAWCRLLATFRAVYAGVQHEAMRLPPYGGTLFDPDRYPFLEGRALNTKWTTTAAIPLPINNRVVLHLLEALQILRVKVPGGGPAEARRLSFRALDIEQIGHVYEGLLDHTARRAQETILGLTGSKDKEPEIPLSKLEELARRSTADLVEYLREQTGKTENSLTRLLTEPPEIDDHTLSIACAQDGRLAQRVKPFAAVLRQDSFDRLVVIPEGSVYVTRGSDRRNTGTHYTPRSLTEPIVKYTLEPLVYVGPAEGNPKEAWQLKSPKEILGLKVCDMAMGSGAFLVQACRYLAERLVEAWEYADKTHPGEFATTTDGEVSTGSTGERLIPTDAEEQLVVASRTVADRCLYGVDINPMAVEMAKLSLWLITLQRDRPFTFLDHALKCGDSLLGVSTLQQIENFSLRSGPVQTTISTVNFFRYIEDAAVKRRALEQLHSNDYTQIEAKTRLYVEAGAATAHVKVLADAVIAFELRGLEGERYEEQRTIAADQIEVAMRKPLPEFQAYVLEQLHGRQTFHWSVEFPEVFARGGFDAFIGNPPFLGGRLISGTFGDEYLHFLQATVGTSVGQTDLCAYFFLRANELVRSGGSFGLLATKTISEGDTGTTGLGRLISSDTTIYAARNSMPWPGTAAVRVSSVHCRRGEWEGTCWLDDRQVTSINAELKAGLLLPDPKPLEANDDRCFKGFDLGGTGFSLLLHEAQEFRATHPDEATILRPYIIGKELYTSPTLAYGRMAFDFANMPLRVAEQYPQALRMIEERVKPYRDGVRRISTQENWWIYNEHRPGLRAAIHGLNRVLVKTHTSNTWAFAFLPADYLFDQSLLVFPSEDYSWFALLQSEIHFVWATRNPSTMKGDLRYTTSHCFVNYPFPDDMESARRFGETCYSGRHQILPMRGIGLTKFYQLFHDPVENSEDIERLRALHVEIDQAVAAAYGWTDLDLGHGFHDTKQGIRYTISEYACHSVLDRLLALNHQRYEEEVRAALHDQKEEAKSSGPRGRKSKADATGYGIPRSGFFQDE